MPPATALSNGFPKAFLKKRIDFLSTYKGFSARRELLVLYARPNNLERHRLGVTAPKTTGSAVIRNRFKRWSKEFYRKADLSEIAKAVDINVFVGSKKLKKEDFKGVRHADFKAQLEQAFKNLIEHYS